MENMLRIMENNEGEISLHRKKEKMIDILAADSRRKIEEATLEKDRLMVKEQQYQSKIMKLEEENW